MVTELSDIIPFALGGIAVLTSGIILGNADNFYSEAKIHYKLLKNKCTIEKPRFFDFVKYEIKGFPIRISWKNFEKYSKFIDNNPSKKYERLHYAELSSCV